MAGALHRVPEGLRDYESEIMNTTVSHNYDHVQLSILAREAHRIARLRFSAEHQHHLFLSWEKKIDVAQRNPSLDAACIELERLISILKDK